MTIKRGTPLIAALAATLLLSACSSPDTDDRRVTDGRTSQWDKNAGAPEASAFMNVTAPKAATEVKGAVQINPQEDIHLLSFVTSEKNAEGIARDLRSEEPLKANKADFAPDGELFKHLGLAEPQTLKGARSAGVCPPCVKDDRRKKVQWIDIYVQALKDDQARVYLKAF
ncbi:hypothetical protein Save01_06851 [Streptomyces avermitilis]|uniref:Secreted protein n=2 Tax=Streptomyces avermitilis TaxID=33903 RepID=Q82GZ7_STRAW|nr:putative secreted protein [Streptomyces avermitilis MA-4680 = NBRC 14893]BBJ51678.1 hypothetical protein SAVMC3_43070 [Streptomyces avermitilis]GDY63716.1 hypothetical protein SAV14893_031090 [Streptomyces avermitilis]GDY76142.1 hypothetical protein SAV31267_056270 [Streptomyces avermitilis]GDY85088.1 hypothetical protein SAVCW2_42870 [Streptomyces avermitilis]